MSKRNLASASSPDVRYETDEFGTKLIIRKFDIPLPAKSVIQPSILRTPLTFCTPKEKWKYQHDVPEGKIYTRRVHELNPKPQTSSKSGKTNDQLSPISQCSSVSKLLPATVQNLKKSLAKITARKDILVMAPNEQSAKLLSTVPSVKSVKTVTQTVNNKILSAEKITLNNMPENVIANSVQVIDSKYVNGRKVVYLKAFKDVGRIVENSTSKVTTETSQCSLEQRKEDIQTIQSIPSGTVAALNDVNREAKSETIVPRTFQNVPNVQPTDSQTGAPISKLRSVLAQKLNVVTHDGKSMANIVSIPSDSTLKNSQVSLSVVSPIIVPHCSVQVSPKPMLPQTTCELKNSNMYFTGPVRAPSNLFGCSSVTPNVINNNREITLQLNATPKLDSHVLTMDPSKKSTIISKNKNNVSYQVVSATSDSTTSGSNNVMHVDDRPSIQEGNLTFVPADSTTPFIVNSSSTTTSVNSNIDNCNTTEAILVVNQEDITSPKDVINANLTESSVQCVESNITCSNESNIVIFNKTSSNLNLTSPNINMIPKQTINYDEIMRRRKIAMQYQPDMQKNWVIRGEEKSVELPARKVRVVETSTQTSLFCLLERGRMVEMFLNEESKDPKISLQNKNSTKSSNFELLKNKTLISNNEINMKGPSDTENCNLNLSSNQNSGTNEKIDPPVSKRIRLDEGNSSIDTLKLINGTSQNSVNECTFLQAPMDFQDYIQPHMEGIEKENFIESGNKNVPSKIHKINEHGFQNNNINFLPLTCKQSTMNSSVNSNGRNTICNRSSSDIVDKKTVQRLFEDFRISLKPDDDGNLPIHNAVMDSDHKLVERQCLVLNGQKQSVNVKNIRKETPLHLAVLCHNLKIIELLLRYNAKINLPDGAGNTALHMAIIWGNNIEILKTLLAAVEDGSRVLSEPNDEGYSLLHLCALHNKINEAVILIKKKANVNIRDRKSGRTPLFHAVENTNTEMSRMLINSGASTTIPNFSGQTPLNASEVTLVLDQVIGNPETPRTSKSLAVPCPCQNNNSLDTEVCLSQGNNIVELITNGNISDNFVIDNVVFHDR